MTDYFLQLPADAISHVLHHLTIQGSVRVREVCRYLNTTVLAIINSPSYWQQRVATQLEGKKPYTGASHLMMSLALEMVRDVNQRDFAVFLMHLNIPDITIYFVGEMTGYDACRDIAESWNPNTRRRQDILKELATRPEIIFGADVDMFGCLPALHIKDALLPALRDDYPLIYEKFRQTVEVAISGAAEVAKSYNVHMLDLDLWRCLPSRLPQIFFDRLHLVNITYDDLLRYCDDVEATRGLLRSIHVREAYDVAVEMGLLDKATPEVIGLYSEAGLPLAVSTVPTNVYAAIRHHTRYLQEESRNALHGYLTQ